MSKKQKNPEIQPLQTFLLNKKPYHYLLSSSGDVILKKGESPVNKPADSKKPVKPTLEEVKEYFKVNGYSEEGAIKGYNHYESGNEDGPWKDTHGKVVINWKQKMRTNWMKDEYKLPVSAPKKLVM